MSKSYLALQLIQIRYTDDERGREHAEKRERIRAMALPAIEGDGVFHDCRVDSWRNFDPWTMTSGIPWRGDHIYVHGLMLRLDERSLAIGVDPGAEVWKLKRVCDVAKGEWARVLWNQKAGDGETKWLVQLVLNGGFFDHPPPSDVFLGPPASEHDLRRDFLRNAYR